MDCHPAASCIIFTTTGLLRKLKINPHESQSQLTENAERDMCITDNAKELLSLIINQQKSNVQEKKLQLQHEIQTRWL